MPSRVALPPLSHSSFRQTSSRITRRRWRLVESQGFQGSVGCCLHMSIGPCSLRSRDSGYGAFMIDPNREQCLAWIIETILLIVIVLIAISESRQRLDSSTGMALLRILWRNMRHTAPFRISIADRQRPVNSGGQRLRGFERHGQGMTRRSLDCAWKSPLNVSPNSW